MPITARGGVVLATVSTVAMLLGSSVRAADLRAPADFTMSRSDSSPGPVTFSHQQHLAKGVKCSSCHMRDFKLKRGASGPITLDAKLEGKFCGACHDGKTVVGGAAVFPIDECDKCHK
jgi:c(7)-type cytochrome triheme protein